LFSRRDKYRVDYFAFSRNFAAMLDPIDYETAVRQAAIFKALGHPARLQMVMALAQGERCVCELVELTGLGWSTVSRHLAVMKSAGIVADEKRGMQVFYRLRRPCVARFAACLDAADEGQDVVFSVCGCGEDASAH